jgi:hypothetical protein
MTAQLIRLADRRRLDRSIEDEIASYISTPPRSAFYRGVLLGLLTAHDMLKGAATFRNTRLQILEAEIAEAEK